VNTADIRAVWQDTAAGWARWEPTISSWIEPATVAMLEMAGVDAGARVLDIASGAGSQALRAAQQVGVEGQVVASDISDAMLQYVQDNARAAGLTNVTTVIGPAERLDVATETFDAAICRLGLMLFADPGKALRSVRRALHPGGKIAVVVFSTPAANPFLAKAVDVLLRHSGRVPSRIGQPGLFALGSPGVVERLFTDSGFVDIERRTIPVPLQLPTASQGLALMHEALGALRGIVSDCSEAVRVAAWAEIGEMLKSFETDSGFVGQAEVLVAAGIKPRD
jgi:SAM-dependent methyltransferase